MTPVSSINWSTGIGEDIQLVRAELDGVSLAAFETDRRKQWLMERGIEIVSEASCHLPDEMKARHPGIPWRKVAEIGNVLSHEYQRVAHDVLWHAASDDLPPLEMVCRAELATEQDRDRGL